MAVGGGLLGLEAAKAMMDLERFARIRLLERNKWVMSRQLDGEAGTMLVEQVRNLGLDVMLSRRIERIDTGDDNKVKCVTFEDGDSIDCACVCFAIGIKPRDDLAKDSGIKCADEGGGIVVDQKLQTSAKDVYAIGECASWNNSTYGLIAPGIEMADVLAFNLTQAKSHAERRFDRPDLSTKLKLLGVDVASFGDYFADRDGPRHLPEKHRRRKSKEGKEAVKALTYRDPFEQIYKKYIFTANGQYLLGGMMVCRP